MKELVAWNKTMDYIEKHLEDDIDMTQIALLASAPAGLFARIFSMLSGVPLGEYIRQRRLTKAALDLSSGDDKVIDVALRYGYDSVDAFSAAFRRFHQHTPTAVRQGAPFEIMTPMHFTISIKGGNKMDIKIISKEAFQVAGLSMAGSLGAPFDKLWDRLFATYDMDKLLHLGNAQSFGCCYNMKEDQSFRYMAGFDVKHPAVAKEMGLEILSVPAARYAVLKLVGPIPQSIHEGWQYIMGTFFPEQGYAHAGSPDFEVYSAGDMSAADYEMELWVPVVHTK